LKLLKQRIEFSVFAVIALCLLPTDTQSMLKVVALLIASSGKYSRICLIHRLIRSIRHLSVPEKRFVRLIRQLQFRLWCLSS